ncbi:23S rRNA methyltransferase [Robinsoniella peoriensis]|uniref:23S rRNA methyltransferase n=1 Tax=Robinsoniella peoriensis TaxID=180332 RepID=UPI001FA6BFA4|nr:23S rRNA methyltransferase [Robinsoniella peoriensis]
MDNDSNVEMALTAAECKATYEKIKKYVLDNAGIKASQLYIAQVKRKHDIIERVNYNRGDGKAKVPQVSGEKKQLNILAREEGNCEGIARSF